MKYTVTFDLSPDETLDRADDEQADEDMEDEIFEALSSIGADNIQIRGD